MSGGEALEGIDIAFFTGAFEDEDLHLRGVAGRERLSRLFEVDLLLSRSSPLSDDEMEELLHAPCAVQLSSQPAAHIHGVLERIEVIDSGMEKATRYFARMVPTAWLLTLARTNRIFQKRTITEIIEEVLSGYKLAKGTHFDIFAASGPTREYVVQYEESDWDFIQRWLEHEGMFYWFEHGESNDKLMIADANAHTTWSGAPPPVSYRLSNNMSTGGKETIWDLVPRRRRTAARVALIDYNDQTPNLFVSGKADVDAKSGFGSVFSYGEHFKDPGEGSTLAQVRAERLAWEKKTYSGRTDKVNLRAGCNFELTEHPREQGGFLVTSLDYRVGFPVLAGGDAHNRYLARFEAIAKGVPFRPARVTPWPRIDGVLNAHIEEDGSGDYAQIDEQGRYRVKLPFDLSGNKGTNASHWIRMAEPYSGAAYGTHFPLHKGAEVLLGHVLGDPDRPVILAAVPNPRTKSPVVDKNATQSVIRTASGIHIEMEDQQS